MRDHMLTWMCCRIFFLRSETAWRWLDRVWTNVVFNVAISVVDRAPATVVVILNSEKYKKRTKNKRTEFEWARASSKRWNAYKNISHEFVYCSSRGFSSFVNIMSSILRTRFSKAVISTQSRSVFSSSRSKLAFKVLISSCRRSSDAVTNNIWQNFSEPPPKIHDLRLILRTMSNIILCSLTCTHIIKMLFRLLLHQKTIFNIKKVNSRILQSSSALK